MPRKHHFALSFCLVKCLTFLKSTFRILARRQLGRSQRGQSQMYSCPPADRVTFPYVASLTWQRRCARRDTAAPALYDFFISKLSRITHKSAQYVLKLKTLNDSVIMFIKENEYKYFTSYMKLCVWRVNPGKLRSERDLNPGLFGNKPKLCL